MRFPSAQKPRGRSGGKPRKVSPELRAQLKALYKTGEWTLRELGAEFSLAVCTVQKHISRQD